MLYPILVFVVAGFLVTYNPFPLEHEMSVVIYGYSTIAVILNLLFIFNSGCPHELDEPQSGDWEECISCQFEKNFVILNIDASVLEKS